ncbi:hypothetical protein GC093_10895 [Paenibacillus sp. LMG 31456]|uniref:DUF3159 domain-containing protein n=1 Tax=Paenibacillus foliorum TaxID=2654974 RepID=A0A972GPF2_9BACL|nr:VC0807 family protein [Paenibacillus foliorum]NOU93725.1 hypothetical protein [Paenibacillus foliorum]
MNKTRNEIIFTVLLNIAMPYLAYQLLIPYTSGLTALSVAALIPLCDSLVSLIRTKKISAFSSFIFLGIVLGIIAVFIGGDERFILLRESYITGIMGILFLVSLFFSRPLIYYFAERFMGRDSALNDKWSKFPGVRKTFRLITLVWGISLLFESGVKVLLVYSLSISEFLIVSPIVAYGIIGLTIWWNVHYVRQVKKKSVII